MPHRELLSDRFIGGGRTASCPLLAVCTVSVAKTLKGTARMLLLLEDSPPSYKTNLALQTLGLRYLSPTTNLQSPKLF
jgi:hypothetical protein